MSVKEELNFHLFALISYYTNKVFGIFPFSYNYSARSFQKSIFSVLYSLSVVIFMSYFYPMYCVSFYFQMLNRNFRGTLETYVGIIQSTFEFVVLILTNCVYLYHKNDIVDYLNLKISYGEKIVKLSQKCDGKINFLTMILISILTFIVKLIMDTLLIIFQPIMQETDKKMLFAIYLIPNTVTTLIGCTFCLEVISLQFFAYQINSSLLKIAHCISGLSNINSNAKKMIFCCHLSDKVDELLILHSELNDILLKFNNHQNPVLILYHFNKFVEITIPLFFEYSVLTGSSETTPTLDMYASATLINLIGFFELAITAVFCDKLIKEMERTGRILHEFPVQNADDRLKESINKFSLQILQEKRPIIVCGMYRVDNSLLYIMTSSITSYLILLIQFHIEGI
uniref:Gustatory receptor n=1 Tax=Phlebotomus papatasi TaxID=29031 RepID=A0A8W9BM02_PHLPP